MGTLLAYLLLKQENLGQHKRSKLFFKKAKLFGDDIVSPTMNLL